MNLSVVSIDKYLVRVEAEGEITMRDFRAVDGQFPAVFELRDYGPDLSGLAKVRQVIEKMEAIR